MVWDILRDLGLFWLVVGVLGGLVVVVGVALERRAEPADGRVEGWLPPLPVRRQLWEDEITEIMRGKGE